jgi:IS605 OrfB family transposase
LYVIVTLKYRIKDSASSKTLNKMAQSINFVWNYCNEVSAKSLDYNGTWLSQYQLQTLTSGCSKDLGINASSIQEVCREYVNRRNQFKKRKLNWRSKKSLGWIPFKFNNIVINGDEAIYCKKVFKFWKSREVGKIKIGSFNQDSKGNWYINLVCEIANSNLEKTNKSIGVDLGLIATATYSDGSSYEGEKPIRKYTNKLAMAQRANKKKKVKSIHKKITNIRKDSISKETTRLVREYDFIVVGNVSSKKLTKTKMAKSVQDVSWGIYKSMLAYKTIRFGKELKVVKEHWTSKTCHVCNNVANFGGLSGLSVREWTCSNCGKTHDRDVNAAINILRIGHDTPIKGILRTCA